MLEARQRELERRARIGPALRSALDYPPREDGAGLVEMRRDPRMVDGGIVERPPRSGEVAPARIHEPANACGTSEGPGIPHVSSDRLESSVERGCLVQAIRERGCLRSQGERRNEVRPGKAHGRDLVGQWLEQRPGRLYVAARELDERDGRQIADGENPAVNLERQPAALGSFGDRLVRL